MFHPRRAGVGEASTKGSQLPPQTSRLSPQDYELFNFKSEFPRNLESIGFVNKPATPPLPLISFPYKTNIMEETL